MPQTEIEVIHMEGEMPGDYYRVSDVFKLLEKSRNREAFIDWCIENHEEIVKEYVGF